jgi:hypothetical protein
MKSVDAFEDEGIGCPASAGNELDAWLRRYQSLRSSLYGVAETTAQWAPCDPNDPHKRVIHAPDGER